MDIGVVIAGLEQPVAGSGLTETLKLIVLAGQGGGPPAGGIDRLREVMGLGVLEAGLSLRLVVW